VSALILIIISLLASPLWLIYVGNTVLELPRRIVKETKRITDSPPAGIVITPSQSNPRHFHVSLKGPEVRHMFYRRISLLLSPPSISSFSSIPLFSLLLCSQSSPYAGGTFKIEIFLPYDYPMVPPKCHFLTRIYHPNIDRVGRICLDILKDRWSPALQIDKVCLSILLLLQNPNPEDPLDNKVANVMKTNPTQFKKNAIKMTKDYAR
jgi:ubiquitin-conjugating enzyme E2 N